MTTLTIAVSALLEDNFEKHATELAARLRFTLKHSWRKGPDNVRASVAHTIIGQTPAMRAFCGELPPRGTEESTFNEWLRGLIVELEG